MSETDQLLEFARAYFSAAALQGAPNLPSRIDVKQLACCVQGAVLRRKHEFEPGAHLPVGFPPWPSAGILEGKPPALEMVVSICQHFGLRLLPGLRGPIPGISWIGIKKSPPKKRDPANTREKRRGDETRELSVQSCVPNHGMQGCATGHESGSAPEMLSQGWSMIHHKLSSESATLTEQAASTGQACGADFKFRFIDKMFSGDPACPGLQAGTHPCMHVQTHFCSGWPAPFALTCSLACLLPFQV